MKTFVTFMLERLRSNPDLTSDPQALLAPFVAVPSSRLPALRVLQDG